MTAETTAAPDMEWHPAASLMPMATPEEHRGMVADVLARGLLEPIMLLGGAILDGRNRWRACRDAGVAPRFVYFDAATMGDPWEWTASKNLHRRHLTTSQRIVIAAKLRDHFAADARARMLAGKRPDPTAILQEGESSARAAALMGVSTRSVNTGVAMLRDAVPELVDAVVRGDVRVSVAAELAALPPVEQGVTVAAGAKGMKAKAKALRIARDPMDSDPEPTDDEAEVIPASPAPQPPAPPVVHAPDEQRAAAETAELLVSIEARLAAHFIAHPLASFRSADTRRGIEGYISRILTTLLGQTSAEFKTAEAPRWTPRLITGGSK